MPNFKQTAMIGPLNITSGDSGTDTSDATATAADIASGKTAYGATGKITGTLENMTDTGTITFAANVADEVAYSNNSQTSKLTVKSDVTGDCIARNGDTIQIAVWDSVMVSKLGLAPNKLASGYSIFGVTGTVTPSEYDYSMELIPATFASAVTVDQTTVVTDASVINAGEYLIGAGDVITTNWNTIYGIVTYNSDDMTYSITWCNPWGAGDPATFDAGANAFVINSNTLPIHP